MEPLYEKVIVKRDKEGKVKTVVIADPTTHLPIFYEVDRMGMDEVLDFMLTDY